MTKFTSRITPALERWIGSLHLLSGVTIFAIMLAYFALILGRWMRIQVPGVFELQEILLVVCVFPALAYTEIKKQNIRIRIFTGHIPEIVETLMSAFVLLIAIGFMVFAIYYSSGFAFKMYQTGEYRTGAIAYPIWPFRMLIAFGWGLLLVVLIMDFWRDLEKIRKHLTRRSVPK